MKIDDDVVSFFLDSSATNSIIAAKDHASVQLSIADVDEEGRMTGGFKTYAFCGKVRGMVGVCNTLLYKKLRIWASTESFFKLSDIDYFLKPFITVFMLKPKPSLTFQSKIQGAAR